MNRHLATGRLLVGSTVMFLLGGCAAGASPTPMPASPSPAGVPPAAVATPSPTTTATAAATATPASIVVTSDIAFQAATPDAGPGTLDIYAPPRAGPWPVVVMLHGGPPLNKGNYGEYARRVAELGFVVFVPTWGVAGDGLPTYDQLLVAQSTAACAVAFAGAHATEYGGDPSTVIVFGHSAGANMAALVAFARPGPTGGCLGGTALGTIDALVTWEGDWMAFDPRVPWDDAVANDPRVMDGYTPWSFLAKHKDLKVVMLVSDNPGIAREMGDPGTIDAFFGVRDPSGVLRKTLEANGAFADGIFDAVELQHLLFSVLKAQGNPVSLDVMPGSSHTYLSDAGWKVFLGAFGKAASPGIAPASPAQTAAPTGDGA